MREWCQTHAATATAPHGHACLCRRQAMGAKWWRARPTVACKTIPRAHATARSPAFSAKGESLYGHQRWKAKAVSWSALHLSRHTEVRGTLGHTLIRSVCCESWNSMRGRCHVGAMAKREPERCELTCLAPWLVFGFAFRKRLSAVVCTVIPGEHSQI